MRDKTRVVCVDDVLEIASLLCKLIDGEPDMHCVERLNQNLRVLEVLREKEAHVLVLDLNMPGCDCLQIIADVANDYDRCRVIAYSGMADPQTRDAVFNAGGWGLVSKHDSPRAVINAIRLVTSGETVFSDDGH